MPSRKPKVFAYVSDDLYQKVGEFKDTRHYNSYSQALVAILEDYFGCSRNSSVPSELDKILEQKLEARLDFALLEIREILTAHINSRVTLLESQFEQVYQRLDNLKSDRPT